MGHTIEQFSSQCHDLLKNNPGPAGRQKVAEALKEVLLDQTFIAKHLTPTTGEREIIYEDSELGFVIVAHHYWDPTHIHKWGQP